MKLNRKIIITIIILIIVSAGGYFAFQMIQNSGGFRFDSKAESGTIDNKTLEQIQKELDEKVKKNMFSISINTLPEFENGKAEGNLNIENSPKNNYIMEVIITRDDTKDILYTSDGIKPGQVIRKDALDVVLQKGTYTCTATFNALDNKTYEKVGSAASLVKITIKN